MADINELEKRVIKLEDSFNKLASIIVGAMEEKTASAIPTVNAVVSPHLAGNTEKGGYLVNEVDYNDEDANDLGMLMAGVDMQKAEKMEHQASLFKNKEK